MAWLSNEGGDCSVEAPPQGLSVVQAQSLRLTIDNHLVGAIVIQVDQEMLFEIILAANYLDIKPLL